MASPPNPAKAPAVTYEYLFYLPSNERLWPLAQQKAQGLLSVSSTPDTASCRLWPKNLDMTGFLQQQMTGEQCTP
jgi:hypothetical protein